MTYKFKEKIIKDIETLYCSNSSLSSDSRIKELLEKESFLKGSFYNKVNFINKYYKEDFIQKSIRQIQDSSSLSDKEISRLKKIKDLSLIQDSAATAYPVMWYVSYDFKTVVDDESLADSFGYRIFDKNNDSSELYDEEVYDQQGLIDEFMSLYRDEINDEMKEDLLRIADKDYSSPDFFIRDITYVFNQLIPIKKIKPVYYKVESSLSHERFLLLEDAKKESTLYENGRPYASTETSEDVKLLHKLLQTIDLDNLDKEIEVQESSPEELFIVHFKNLDLYEEEYLLFKSREEAWDYVISHAIENLNLDIDYDFENSEDFYCSEGQALYSYNSLEGIEYKITAASV